MKIFIGNLSFDAKEPDVKKVFEGFGIVSSVVIKMKDHKVKSRGFGFVEMPDALQAQAAIAALNGKELMGRPLKVDPARVETDADRKRPEKKEEYQHRKVREKKPWRGNKPWEKRAGSAGGGESKPWQKREAGSKPWHKRDAESKPWQKREGEAKPWKKAGVEAKPWKKAGVEAKPWKKRKPGFKPWEKPRQSPHGAWKNRKSHVAGRRTLPKPVK